MDVYVHFKMRFLTNARRDACGAYLEDKYGRDAAYITGVPMRCGVGEVHCLGHIKEQVWVAALTRFGGTLTGGTLPPTPSR